MRPDCDLPAAIVLDPITASPSIPLSMHPMITRPEAGLTLDFSHWVDGSPESLFPLLCPVREYEWIPDWTCELHHTRSGWVERGACFSTQRGDDRTLWVTTRHDPLHLLVEFAKFSAPHWVELMSLQLSAAAEKVATTAIPKAQAAPVDEGAAGGSRLDIRYHLVGLDTEGERRILEARRTGQPYRQTAERIAELLRLYQARPA